MIAGIRIELIPNLTKVMSYLTPARLLNLTASSRIGTSGKYPIASLDGLEPPLDAPKASVLPLDEKLK